jgi:FdhD protein
MNDLPNGDASAIKTFTVSAWNRGNREPERPDQLAVEEPLEIRIRGRSLAVVMRTPGADVELAAGFLLSEGIVRSRDDIREISPCRGAGAPPDGNILNVFLAPNVGVDFEELTRHVFSATSCGVCGKTTIEAIHRRLPPLRIERQYDSRFLASLPESAAKLQPVFRATGGLHAAAVLDSDGRTVWAREDVGRHNAVDKVIGYGLLNGALPMEDRILWVSGRASFEIMQKALSARIPLVAAVSAPSSLAVEFAWESGQTLLGFVRNGTFNVYAHGDRLR